MFYFMIFLWSYDHNDFLFYVLCILFIFIYFIYFMYFLFYFMIYEVKVLLPMFYFMFQTSHLSL